MALTGGIVDVGATLSQTGGTAKTLTSGLVTVVGGIQLIDASVADIRIQPAATFRIKAPVRNPDGTWSKMKHSVTYVEPYLDATTGKVTYDLVRIEREVRPDLAVANKADLLTTGAQLCIKSPFVDFWANNAL